MANGIIRRVDDLGRIVIPKNLRDGMHINEGDPMEVYLRNGEIIIRKYKKSFKECAEEWYRKHTNLMDRCDFYCHGDYTFCIAPVGLSYSQRHRAGHSKRHVDDTHNPVIARVAAYANAMGKNLNKMIGYED